MALAESEEMNHGFRKYDFADLEVDLLVFEDIDFLYPPADANILEYIDSDVDNCWLTWAGTLVHTFNNKIIILHPKGWFIRAIDHFATIRATTGLDAFWLIQFVGTTRWRVFGIRDIWSWFWPSFRCTSDGRNVCRGYGRVGSLLCLWPGRLSK